MTLAWVAPWQEAFFHVLAFVDTGDAASLFNPEHIAWAKATLAPEGYASLVEDAPLLAEAHRREAPRSWSLSAWPFAYETEAAFLDACRAPSWPAFQEGAAVAMLLTRRAYLAGDAVSLAPSRAALLDVVRPWFEAVHAVAPTDAGCLLSRVLGVRGRAFVFDTPRFVVGVTASARPSHAALQWLHERAVVAATEVLSHDGAWRPAESLAWAATTHLVRGTVLQDEHAHWQRRFDARGLHTPREADVEAVVFRLQPAVPSPSAC